MNAPMFQAKVALAIRYLDGSKIQNVIPLVISTQTNPQPQKKEQPANGAQITRGPQFRTKRNKTVGDMGIMCSLWQTSSMITDALLPIMYNLH